MKQKILSEKEVTAQFGNCTVLMTVQHVMENQRVKIQKSGVKQNMSTVAGLF